MRTNLIQKVEHDNHFIQLLKDKELTFFLYNSLDELNKMLVIYPNRTKRKIFERTDGKEY
jgi:hypothetical protein